MAVVTGNVTVNLGLQMKVTAGVLAPVTYPVPINTSTNYSTSGTAAGQLDKIYGATVALVASTPVTLDLTNLTGPDGSTMNLARVREFCVSVVTVTSAFNVTVYRGASNGWLFLPDSTHALTVPANGAEILIRDPNSSGAGVGYVTGGSSRTITLDPGANNVTVAVLIAGTSVA